MNRVLGVARLQLTTWKQSFGWPVAILGLSFALNLLFYASMADAIDGPQVTGGLISIYIFQCILCSQVMTQWFSFAVGLNVTRRTFLAASGVVILLQSMVFAVLLYGMAMLEQLTDGWGVRMTYFTLMPITDGYSPLSIVIFFVPMLVFSFFGLLFGVIGKRWGTNGVLSATLLSLLLLGGAVVFITWLDSWGQIWGWFADQPGLALALGWTLVPLVLFAGGSYALTRRAVP
jgi:hypothetical protein